MTPSMEKKLRSMIVNRDELAARLAEPDQKQESFRELSRKYARLQEPLSVYEEHLALRDSLEEASELLSDTDAEIREMAQQEVDSAESAMQALQERLQVLMIPVDPDDDADVYMEIRAGTGGEEAGLFAAELFRLYSRYADGKGWQLDVISAREGETGGYREVIAHISGGGVFHELKYESGVHRVQRVPQTESQGRIHTSTCTVAILPEQREDDEISIAKDEIRVDTYRASGAGGQHINKTDSAVRLTHLPTGIAVECQQERSQHQNRARAMALLIARLKDEQQQQKQASQIEARRSMIGTGERSEKIRTYNFPQGRITDHRIGLTLYRLNEVLQGDLEGMVSELRDADQAAYLRNMQDE